MKKYIIGSLVGVLLLSISVVSAKTQGADPFAPLWAAIAEINAKLVDLQNQITNIQLISGPQGEKGEKGDPGPAGEDGTAFHLEDANGQDLGLLLDAHVYYNTGENPKYRTYIQEVDGIMEFTIVDQVNPVIRVASAKGLGSGDNPLLFRFPDCTIDARTEKTLPDERMIVRIETTAGPRYFKWSSDMEGFFWRPIASNFRNGTCYNDNPSQAYSIPLKEIFLPFSEPVVWPLRIVK